MVTLPVRSFVDPDSKVMKTKLEPVSPKTLMSRKFRREIETVVGSLQEKIYTPGSHAVAVAANQVGIAERFFVMLTMITENDGLTDVVRARRIKKGLPVPEVKKQLGIVALINPELISVRGVLAEDWEGCLSYPGKQFLIDRYPTIKVRYINNKGETVEEELDGLDARIFLHEMDHLDGIRPIDKAKETREAPKSGFNEEDLREALGEDEEPEETPEDQTEE